MVTIEVVPMLLRRIEKARPAAVQYESPARLMTLKAPLLNHWKRKLVQRQQMQSQNFL